MDNNQAWFINFYSPHCHHCHELAPTWRKLASDFEGIIRFGAVNCEEDWVLCNQLKIESFPTLLYYEKEAPMHDGEYYEGSRRLSELSNFIISKITVNVQTISVENWELDGFDRLQWLLFFCPEGSSNCPEEEMRLKVAAAVVSKFLYKTKFSLQYYKITKKIPFSYRKVSYKQE